MGIDRLRYFAAVVETKNLRLAAEVVGISPPSMSKAIAVLEEELGQKLIHPEGRGIGITPKGEEIYRMASTLLEEHRRLYQRVALNIDRPRELRIATFEVFSSYFLSAFFHQEPDLDALVLEMTPGKIERAILDGIVDLGITYLPSPDPSLEYREIGDFRFGIYGKSTWSKKPFADWPFAVPVTELKINSLEIDSLDMWPRKSPKRKVKYKFELLETALHTARMGLAVLHCPDFIISLQNQYVNSEFQLIKLSNPSGYHLSRPLTAYVVAKKGTLQKSIEGKFAKFMRSMGCK